MNGVGTMIAQKLINFRMAECEIFKVRAFGGDTSFEDIVKSCGFAGENDFWEAALSEPMKTGSFVHLLRDCLLPPAYVQTPEHAWSWSEELKRIEGFLHHSLAIAYDQEGQPWFFKTGGNELYLRPREGVAWLWSKPFRRNLVPESLRRYMGYEAGMPAQKAVQKPGFANPPGKRPDSKLSDVSQALRDIYPNGEPDSVDRAHMQREVQKRIGRDVSLRTIDRARAAAWPR